MRYFILFVCFTATLASANEALVSRIGFGSCAFQGRPQPIWKTIGEAKPELFLLIGDNIYGDTKDMQVLKDKYEQFNRIPEFAAFRANVPLIGTWDDHDYGQNDAGVEYPKKKESQQICLDFFQVATNSPRREQEGVYHSEIQGPEGKRVQIILLDTRYFRSKPVSGPEGKRYGPNTDPAATILGETQWRWFEEQLLQPAEIRIIASSIQVISEDHGGEKWMNFPVERERLYALLKKTKAEGIIFLSGDRHFADLSMMNAGIGYPLYDLTSSGLNQGRPGWRGLEVNRHRVGGMGYDNNFGMILVNWDKPVPEISLQIRDEEGDIRVNQKLLLSALKIGTMK